MNTPESTPAVQNNQAHHLQVVDGDNEAPKIPSWASKGKSGEVVKILFIDPALQDLSYNELTGRIENRHGSKLPWGSTSLAQPGSYDALVDYLKEESNTPYDTVERVLRKMPVLRSYNPVKDYLEKVHPQWDGKRRVDSLLVDYLGAEDTELNRQFTRKTLVAAVMRALNPGCKHDTMLVLEGGQGIGKSTLIGRLGKQWASDGLSMSDMSDTKKAHEKMNGKWIVEIAELAGMNKTEANDTKSFLSKATDRYRPAYGREALDFPRRCIFIGTTNDDQYLSDPTGNRRYWPVKCSAKRKLKSWEITEETVDQIWAEAYSFYLANEGICLDEGMKQKAQEAQDSVRREDEWEGLIEAWANKKHPTAGPFAVDPNCVCPALIWVECLGGKKGSMKRPDSNRIVNCLKALGYERSSKRIRFEDYGQQRPWVKPQ